MIRERAANVRRAASPVTTVLLASILLVPACGELPEVPHLSETRDSAGVQIIRSSAPEWPAGGGWRLAQMPDLVIGEQPASSDEEFTSIRRVFTLPGGEVAVVNQSRPPGIRVFDGAGKHIRTIGGAGDGPGEFRFIWDAWLAKPDTLVVFDAGLSRVTRFTPDGTVIDITLFEQKGSAGLATIAWDRFDDGSFLMRSNRFFPEGTTGTGRSVVPVLRASPEGEILDTVGVFPDVDYVVTGEVTNALRFGGFSVQAVLDNEYYRGMGDTFAIDVYDIDGRFLRSIRREFNRRPVSDDIIARLRQIDLDTVKDAQRERVTHDWDVRPHAEYFPAYGNNWIMDADSNLWVPGYTTGIDDVTDWSVFARDGRWLGIVRIPTAFRLEEIGTGYVMGVWRNDLDVQTVRRYPLTGK
jgi:6-bladed beta-propeller